MNVITQFEQGTAHPDDRLRLFSVLVLYARADIYVNTY